MLSIEDVNFIYYQKGKKCWSLLKQGPVKTSFIIVPSLYAEPVISYGYSFDLRPAAKNVERKFFYETSFILGESCVKNWRRLEKSNFLAQVCEMFFI